MNTYTFSYFGWVPEYLGFDQVEFDVEAENEQQAWVKAVPLVEPFAKSEIVIVAINGEDLYIEQSDDIKAP